MGAGSIKTDLLRSSYATSSFATMSAIPCQEFDEIFTITSIDMVIAGQNADTEDPIRYREAQRTSLGSGTSFSRGCGRIGWRLY